MGCITVEIEIYIYIFFQKYTGLKMFSPHSLYFACQSPKPKWLSTELPSPVRLNLEWFSTQWLSPTLYSTEWLSCCQYGVVSSSTSYTDAETLPSNEQRFEHKTILLTLKALNEPLSNLRNLIVPYNNFERHIILFMYIY